MILGDDLVLFDKRVAMMYLEVMKRIGVQINLSKSLISHRGVGEFAKRLFSPNGELQGVSLREFSSLRYGFSNLVNLLTKLRVKRSVALRLLGYGSRACGRALFAFTRFSSSSYLDHLLMIPLRES